MTRIAKIVIYLERTCWYRNDVIYVDNCKVIKNHIISIKLQSKHQDVITLDTFELTNETCAIHAIAAHFILYKSIRRQPLYTKGHYNIQNKKLRCARW